MREDRRDLKSIAPVDFVIIDGAPQAADLAVWAIKACDFALIPVQPSPYDIWTTSDLVDLVKQRIEITDGKLQARLRRLASNHRNEHRQGNDRILEGYELPVLQSRVPWLFSRQC